jgi:hypothetical protein
LDLTVHVEEKKVLFRHWQQVSCQDESLFWLPHHVTTPSAFFIVINEDAKAGVFIPGRTFQPLWAVAFSVLE